MVAMLRQKGADLMHVANNGHNALTMAASRPVINPEPIMTEILGSAPFGQAAKQLINHRLPDGRTVMHVACSNGNLPFVRWLLQHGFGDLNAISNDGQTPFFKVSTVCPWTLHSQQLFRLSACMHLAM